LKKFIFVFLLTLWTVPLLIPLPQIYETEDHKSLAYEDSEFINIDGIDIHVIKKGEGEKTFLLLHGFGSHSYTWFKIMDELSKIGTVIAFDRPAFGLTERVLNSSLRFNPYSTDYSVELTKKILNYYEIDKAIFIGNSAGGTVSILSYFYYPEKVESLILINPAVYTGNNVSLFNRIIFKIPHVHKYGPYVVSKLLNENGDQIIISAWSDPSLIDDETLENYRKPLKIKNWENSLWDFTISSQNNNVKEKINEIKIPVLIIGGKEDNIIPIEDTIKLHENIEDSILVVLENCGHVPQEECPEIIIKIINEYVFK